MIALPVNNYYYQTYLAQKEGYDIRQIKPYWTTRFEKENYPTTGYFFCGKKKIPIEIEKVFLANCPEHFGLDINTYLCYAVKWKRTLQK